MNFTALKEAVAHLMSRKAVVSIAAMYLMTESSDKMIGPLPWLISGITIAFLVAQVIQDVFDKDEQEADDLPPTPKPPVQP